MTHIPSFGCVARVLGRWPYTHEDLDLYLESGGYRTALTPARPLDRVAALDLRGRGGAAFPLATKLRAVMRQPGVPVVVANAPSYMKLHVDPTSCQADGLCHEQAPDRIELDEWGYASLPRPDVPADSDDAARAAVGACPNLALRLEPK